MSRVSIDRRPGERVEIGPDIWVDVTRIKGQRVRLCVTAPPEVIIHRSEPLGIFPKPDDLREAS